ncbi:RNA-binding protein Y14-like [Pyrus communis]|uniref:RNA-binding protein Y14-like n=1 Tax=Pyrus communis TaxID=23211 RepID=UPI00051099E5
MEGHCEDDPMEEEVVEAMPRRIKGRGGLRAPSKTLDLDHPNNPPSFPRCNASQSPSYAPQRSIEGWIILITGIHEEVQEDDLFNVFGDYGAIKDLHLNLDRRTGFVKGYVLIEYEKFEEAKAAISGMNGAKLFGQTISGDWAFSTGSFGGNLRSPELNRSRSPRRRY